MSRLSTLSALVTGVALLAACADRAPTATGPGLSASQSGVPFTAELASPAWQGAAVTLATQASLTPFAAARVYALVGAAQYLAVQQAEAADGGSNLTAVASAPGIGAGGENRRELDRGAVAGASAVVLSHLFPSQAQALDEMVRAQANAGPGRPHPAFARGGTAGRAVGARIVARAQTDGFSLPFTGPFPTGPGLWISNTTPPTFAGGQLARVTPWFLTSASQFRPEPPPAFGSSAFLAGLDEIRQISDTRTAEQVAIATFWALNAGTPTTAGFWLQVATGGISQRGLSERDATHLYALLGTTMFDALIACWDAKETYWFVRPWQADPLITTLASVGRPNHPSYPSGHSCVSSSGAAILSAFFPEERDHLAAMVTEAGLSRMYAGIHYRFDIEAGQALGRNVAELTLAADASGQSVLTLR